MDNAGFLIQQEIDSFSNILEATNILHENGIILEFDASKLKERIIKIINSIIERVKKIIKWIKNHIIDKVIKAGKKIWDKLTKFNKVQEEVETKIEEAKKSDDPKVEEKVKTIEEQIDDFLNEKVNVDILDKNSLKPSPLYYIIFDKFIARHDYSFNYEIDKNKSVNNLYNLLVHYDFSQQMITRKTLNKHLNDYYSPLKDFIEKGYNGFLIKFIKEKENEIKELENKKKEIENISVENIQSLKDFENFGNRSNDIKHINNNLHYANRDLSLYQKALGIINQNYNNIIKAKGEYVVFFNKIKSQFGNNSSSDTSSDNTNIET